MAKKIFITAPRLNDKNALLNYQADRKTWEQVTDAVIEAFGNYIEDGDTVFFCETQGLIQYLPIQLRKKYGQNIHLVYHKPCLGVTTKWQEGLFGPTFYKQEFLKAFDEIVPAPKNAEYNDGLIRKRNNKYIDEADIILAVFPNDMWKYTDKQCAIDMRVAVAMGKPVHLLKYMQAQAKDVTVTETFKLMEGVK